MIQIQQLKLRAEHSREQLMKKTAALLQIPEKDILHLEVIRRSIDARKKPDIYYIYCLEAEVKREEQVLKNALKRKENRDKISKSERVVYRYPVRREGINYGTTVVVGAGPGGLFCAYLLAAAGLKPVLLERGDAVEERKAAVERFWQTGVLDVKSNVQFGEGGAGTFSDGKLNTLVKDKEGRNRAVLELFVKFGAEEKILYEAKAHIGTDVLSDVIVKMRNEILALGGQIRFRSQVTDILMEEDDCFGQGEEPQPEVCRKIKGVVINGTETLYCDNVVLAIGHSARDTFQMLYENKIPMEQKSFAVGFRVEHPQEMINQIQYARKDAGSLGAAAYKVTAQASDGRGVYSFCMCPGGYVVNASSEEGYLAVNGMSYSGRGGKNANSAIIVSVGPADYGSTEALAGVAFQRQLEKKAYELAGGKIPVQRFGDFKKNVSKNESLGRAAEGETAKENGIIEESGLTAEAQITPCCKGKYAWADLTQILPKACNKAFIEGMTQFGRQLPGFDRPETVLAGIESRTSSPVRITRRQDLQSVAVKGLYPCGEGAGYAGGITSAAMDGMRVAEAILKSGQSLQ